MKNIFALLLVTAGLTSFMDVRAQAGKDGAETISSAGVIFNRYSVVTATASAGTNTITVANITDLDASNIAGAANNPYTTAALKFGDLIMIIKMQGATINTTNALAYGTVTANNNVGVYELKTIIGTTGNVITVCNNLANTYTVGGTERVQVVRIPRLSSLTINGGASLTCTAWSGSFKGGIVAVEVNGNTVINGSINVSGSGYRGGAVDNNTTGPPGTSNYVSTSSNDGGEKGEGIAGYQTDYDAAGRYDRGAPANGGGGGVSHNSGGGGGANGNNGNTWTGQGVMTTNGSNPLAAWALDPGYIAAGGLTNSSGGGRGGYSYGANDRNATTTAPGNALWAGDNRREIGGLGGRPLTYASNQLYMGGGGGAGDANNSAAQNGANGGGIIYLLVTGNVSGTGSINANGANAGATISGHNDAPGGGGAGGAIGLNVQGTITGVTITANGGTGGNQLITSNESEGPGGGGGGGFIRTTGTPTVSVTGGANGTTSSTAVTEFTFNGATNGATGAIVNSQAFVAAPANTCFPLPLHLISFRADLSGSNEGVLRWTTEQESAIRDYQPEISTDGRQWRTFNTVPARNSAVQQTYSVNTGVIGSQTFYRLRINELTGSSAFSDVRALSVPGKLRVTVQGNELLMTGLALTPATVRLYASDGRMVSEVSTTGSNSMTLHLEKTAPGVYYLRVTGNDGRTMTQSFVKQ